MSGKHIHSAYYWGRGLTVRTGFIDHLLYVPRKELAAMLGPGCRFEARGISPAPNGYYDSRTRYKLGACFFNRRERWPGSWIWLIEDMRPHKRQSYVGEVCHLRPVGYDVVLSEMVLEISKITG